MNNSARTLLFATFSATLFFLLGLVLFGYWRDLQAPADRLEYSKLYVEAFKVIVISFFVALVGILVPARVREVQLTFERWKESRVAYSKAKTGVAYLPVQLCTLDFTEAAKLIQQVHFYKHQAELYSELKKHVKHLHASADDWGESLYDRLVAFRTVLETHVSNWDSLQRNERMKLLVESRAVVDKKWPNLPT